jgi:hypothetical protein
VDKLILLQDPADDDSPNVLEAILEACKGATMGGGIFAFASPAGISLLFKDEEFSEFVRRSQFDLIVGLDSITSERSLELLGAEAQRSPKLAVRAFLNKRSVTFHPKFCWFSSPRGGAAVVGSGNLTPGGLAGNWEAFAPVTMGAAEVAEVQAQWAAWKELHAPELLPVDAPAAIARARSNKRRVIAAPDAEEEALAAPPDPQVPTSVSARGDDVFITELPRASNRWAQANFDLDHFRSYFHLDPGSPRRVLLWHVDPQGKIGEIEVRRSVSVRSHNFRIELAAAANLDYPSSGRPIAVFRRVGTRRFRYRLVMPSDPEFRNVARVLEQIWSGPPSRVRRITMSAAELKRRWAASPV